MIVRDDTDRDAFVARLGDVAQATRTAIYAWALLPNHRGRCILWRLVLVCLVSCPVNPASMLPRPSTT